MRNFYRALIAILVGSGAIAGVASAQSGKQDPAGYPSKPIRLIVPYPPGGGNDMLARMLKDHLERTLRQPIVVENRPGANGILASELVAKAPGDGYTLLMGSVATHAINPALYRSLPYNPRKDFAPVAVVGETPMIITVHPSVKASSLKELIALAKAEPGRLSYASVGSGSTAHLTGELFKTAAGVDLLHVPYKGISQATTELIGGQVSMAFSNVVNVLPYLKSNKLRPIAVTGKNRAPGLPDVPAVTETLKDFEVTLWWGLFAPAATPKPIVDKLNAEVNRALARPETREQWAKEAITLTAWSPDEFSKLLQRDIEKWSGAVKLSGAKID